nr:SPFH domain-containing protein [Prauserella isguenensis]
MQAAVIERGGRFHAVAGPGLTLRVPFLDKVRTTVDLREQVLHIPAQPVVTSDRTSVSIGITAYFAVVDVRASVYDRPGDLYRESESGRERSVGESVERVVTLALREFAGTDGSNGPAPDIVGNRVRDEADRTAMRWGVRVRRVEVRPMEPSPSSHGPHHGQHHTNIHRGSNKP